MRAHGFLRLLAFSAKVDATLVAMCAVCAAGLWVMNAAGQTRPPQGILLEPVGQAGEAIYPAFEGWGPTRAGSSVLLLGYFNRNKQQELDIPIGPDNRIEPGGPDFGQPTHFHTGRQYGVFAIPIPKDFGNKKLTWTIVANGQTASVSFWTNPPYWIDFYKNLANGNEPPRIKFSPAGPELMGPPGERFVQTLNGTVGQPVALTLWAADKPPTVSGEAEPTPPAATGDSAGRGGARPGQRDPSADPLPAIIGGRVLAGGVGGAIGGGGAATRSTERRGDYRVVWKKYRGPGEVKIADDVLPLFNKGDAALFVEARTTATFSSPGEYWLRAQINDSSGDGGGGDQCCWTTAHVVVIVK
jgi:hypothetical protein